MHATLANRSIPREIPSWRDSEPEPLLDPVAGWPLLATPVPAGFPIPADDTVERRLSLDDHLIRHSETTFFLRVQGNELREWGIQDGDLLVADRATPPSTGSLVVAVTDGRFRLARLNRDARGRRVLHAAQADHLLSPGDHGLADSIWGVVRWTVRRLWPGL